MAKKHYETPYDYNRSYWGGFGHRKRKGPPATIRKLEDMDPQDIEFALECIASKPGITLRTIVNRLIRRMTAQQEADAREASAEDGEQEKPVLPYYWSLLEEAIEKFGEGKVVAFDEHYWPRMPQTKENVLAYLEQYGPTSGHVLSLIFADQGKDGKRSRKNLSSLLYALCDAKLIYPSSKGYRTCQQPEKPKKSARAAASTGKSARAKKQPKQPSPSWHNPVCDPGKLPFQCHAHYSPASGHGLFRLADNDAGLGLLEQGCAFSCPLLPGDEVLVDVVRDPASERIVALPKELLASTREPVSLQITAQREAVNELPAAVWGQVMDDAAYNTNWQHTAHAFYIPLEDLGSRECPPGSIVKVLPEERSAKHVHARIVEFSVDLNPIRYQEHLVKLNHEVPGPFPAAALAEAAQFPEQPTEQDMEGRRDLRPLCLVTMDGPDARDFDDAICVERLPDGFRLTVAIADVTHYVRHGSAMDKEALVRGNSWYFPTSVEPMLPFELSHGLCSLRPQVDRLVLWVAMTFDAQGRRTGYEIGPGVMRSRARLTYDGARHLVARMRRRAEEPVAAAVAEETAPSPAGNSPASADPERQACDREIAAMLDTALELGDLLNRQRVARGALDLDLPEATATFNKDGTIRRFFRLERHEMHRLIEECMLAANEAVAEFLLARDIPFPARVHPAPNMDKLRMLMETPPTNAFMPDRLTSQSLPMALAKAKGSPLEPLVQIMIVRSLALAVYSAQNTGHYGLASNAYCHFTSPIRRYADVLVHRAVKYALSFDQDTLPAGQRLVRIADMINVCERSAQLCEREMRKRLACMWMQKQSKKHSWTATITTIEPWHCFVELDEFPVSGMVSFHTPAFLRELADRGEIRRPMEIRQDWDTGECYLYRGKKRYPVGTRVLVRLDKVDMVKLYIDFTLLEILQN